MHDAKGELHSLVVPVYNEIETLPEFHRRATAAMSAAGGYELIFVDDGSTDGSWEKIASLAAGDAHVRALRLARNFGQQMALTAGIDMADGDTVTVIDCDLQDPPELVPTMIEKWREGADVVFAVRSRREGETWFKRGSAAVFYRLLRMITDVDIPADHSEFRLVSRRVADGLRTMRERHRYTRGLVSWMGMERAYVTYERSARERGTSKYTLSKLMRLAIDSAVGFSPRPLQLATFFGFLSSGLAFGYALFAVIFWAVTRRPVEGWTSLIGAFMFVGGVQLITVGIIGEYVGRIYDEVLRRPLYVVSGVAGFPEERAGHFSDSVLPDPTPETDDRPR